MLATRQRWLGHMLRSEEGLLARQVLLAEVSWHKEAGLAYREGSLLSECPAHDSAEHLVDLAEQKEAWRLWAKKPSRSLRRWPCDPATCVFRRIEIRACTCTEASSSST